jgi:hypothetical protein
LPSSTAPTPTGQRHDRTHASGREIRGFTKCPAPRLIIGSSTGHLAGASLLHSLALAVAVEPGRGSWPDASTSSRWSERRQVGVRRFRFPPEVITLAVRWYLRYGLSYRDVEELLAERGVTVDHVAVYRWVQRFTPLFADAARAPAYHG